MLLMLSEPLAIPAWLAIAYSTFAAVKLVLFIAALAYLVVGFFCSLFTKKTVKRPGVAV